MIRKMSNMVLRTLSSANHVFGYWLNDPSTPELSEVIPCPGRGHLSFNVEGLAEDPMSPENSSQKRASNCHFVIGQCLNNIQRHCKVPVKAWAGAPELMVYPAAGRDMNAYYDRRSLKFFYYPHAGKNIYFSDSSDIVTHELGHAFLDAMRPDFWSVQSLEIWSFHEAFSDIVAMFNIMSYDRAIKFAIEQTKGDMERSNVISRLAEEVGCMIREVTRDPSYLPDALRDPALEHFNYVSPNELPAEAPNNMLASECHSFGRVFSGAWYKIFVRLFEMRSKSLEPVAAFKSARDEAFSILMHAIPASPRVDKYYAAVARSMCVVARGKNEVVHDIVSSVFSEFNILRDSDVRNQSSGDIRHEIISSLSKHDRVLKTSKSVAVCLKKRKFINLSELPIVSLLSLDKSVKIEVPYDSYYEFDEFGELSAQMVPDHDLILNSASKCLSVISDHIGKGKMWDVEFGILKRQFIK